MTKVTLDRVLSSYSSSTKVNSNAQTIEEAFDNTLSRDGSSPNEMLADIDMNSFQLINLDTPTIDHNAATKVYVDGLITGLSSDDLAINALNGVEIIQSRATALGTSILSNVNYLVTLGYSIKGDQGGGRYKRVTSTPSHMGYFTSLDGAIWELDEYEPNVHQFGAKGDDSTDDATAIQAASLYAQSHIQSYQPDHTATIGAGYVVGTYTQTVPAVHFVSGKIYKIGTPITLYSGNRWEGHECILKPHSSLSASAALVQSTSDYSTFFNGRFVTMKNITFDGGYKQVYIVNGNIGGSKLLFEDCEFIGASNVSNHLIAESARVDYVRCKFEQNVKHILNENDTNGSINQVFFWDCAFQQPKWTATGQCAIENRGYYTNATDNAGSILTFYGGSFSGFDEPTHSYTGLSWIKNNNGQAVKCYDVRFPRESGGVVAIDNYTSFRTADTAPPTELVLSNCELSDDASNSSDRIQGIRLNAVPNILIVSGCKCSHYTSLVEFGTGTTPSTLVSGGTRDLIKIDIKNNWSPFNSSSTPISDYIPSVLRPFDVWAKATFSAHKNGTNQTTIADNTNTKLTFGTELFDTHSIYDASNSKVTGFVGKMLIQTTVSFSGTIDNTAVSYLSLYKNGSLFKAGQTLYSGSTAGGGLIGSWVVDSITTDYWEVYVCINTSAGTGTVDGTATLSFIQGSEL